MFVEEHGVYQQIFRGVLPAVRWNLGKGLYCRYSSTVKHHLKDNHFWNVCTDYRLNCNVTALSFNLYGVIRVSALQIVRTLDSTCLDSRYNMHALLLLLNPGNLNTSQTGDVDPEEARKRSGDTRDIY